MHTGIGWELAALWSLAMAIIASVVALALLGPDQANSIHNTVIAGLVPTLPMVLNAIRSIRQAQVMNKMAEQLGSSTPSHTRLPLDLTGMEEPRPQGDM